MKSTPLVIWALDMYGWCFHNIAKKVSYHLSDKFSFKIQPHHTIADEDCDILISMWWGNTSRLNSVCRASRILGMIYDGLSWTINEGSRDGCKINLNSMDGVGICNKSFLKTFQDNFVNAPPTFLLEDGVDTELFRPVEDFPKDFTLGWVGNSTRITPGGPHDQKGLNFIKRACTAAGVRLRILDAAKAGKNWPHEQMPMFYNSISAIAIGAYMEGTPNPLLEGLACGRPALTTPVGLAPEIVKENENGWFINRDNFEGCVEKLKEIKRLDRDELLAMSKKAHESAYSHSWVIKSTYWREALINLLEAPTSRKVPAGGTTKSVQGKIGANINPVAANKKGKPAVLANPGNIIPAVTNTRLDTCRTLVKEAEKEKAEIIQNNRPVVYVTGLFRFESRTIRIIKHMVDKFKFIPVEQGVFRASDLPDLIWALYPYGETAAALDAQRRYNVPIIGTMRGIFWKVEGCVTGPASKKAANFYSKADCLISLSDALINTAKSQYPGWKSKKFVKIPNGGYLMEAKLHQNVKPYDLDLPRPWIGLLTNWAIKSKAKGALELIEKLQAYKNFTGTLLIGGAPGKYSPPEGQLHEKIHNIGWVENRWRFFKSINALIHHSYEDSQPSVIMEALSTGTPVLTTVTDVTGSHEFVRDDITGFVDNNIETLAARFLTTPKDKLKTMQQAAINEVATFYNWELTAERHTNVFYEALKNRNYEFKQPLYNITQRPSLPKLSSDAKGKLEKEKKKADKLIERYEKSNRIDNVNRPIIYVVGLLRFESQTFKILKHLCHDFKFIPLNQGFYDSEEKPDLILSVYPYQPGVASLHLQNKFNVPIVACMRGEFWHCSEKIQQSSYKAATMIYDSAEAIICLANTTVKNTIDAFPQFNPNKFHVIPNGGYLDEKKTYTRNWHTQNKKRYNELKKFMDGFPKPWVGVLTNFAFNAKAYPTQQLIDYAYHSNFPGTLFIGGTPGKHELEIGKLNNNAYNLGHIEDIWTFYSVIDWYMHYSLMDSQPGVILEASSFITPVACIKNCETGSHEFVKDNITGIVSDNIEELFQRLLGTSERKRLEFGAAGYKDIKENYDWKIAARGYRDIFNKVLNGKK